MERRRGEVDFEYGLTNEGSCKFVSTGAENDLRGKLKLLPRDPDCALCERTICVLGSKISLTEPLSQRWTGNHTLPLAQNQYPIFDEPKAPGFSLVKVGLLFATLLRWSWTPIIQRVGMQCLI